MSADNAARFGKLGETVIGGVHPTDSHPRKYVIDPGSHALPVIQVEHYMIHRGKHFNVTDSASLDSAGTQTYMIQTEDSDTFAHMFILKDGSGITQFDLYEGSDKSGATDGVLTPVCNNRNSTCSAVTQIFKGTSGTDSDGTLIYTYKGGASSAQSRDDSQSNIDSEIVLKKNTKYLLRTTSGTNANLTNVRFSWYELEALG